jgi:hypothetical protein
MQRQTPQPFLVIHHAIPCLEIACHLMEHDKREKGIIRTG